MNTFNLQKKSLLTKKKTFSNTFNVVSQKSQNLKNKKPRKPCQNLENNLDIFYKHFKKYFKKLV